MYRAREAGLDCWDRWAIGTYMMSTCSQSAPCEMVREHAAPRSAKSAERIDGAMMALGAMVADFWGWGGKVR